jgi:CBS domain-containing protein
VVLDPDRKPVGILTDRDVTLRAVGRGLDPTTTPLSQVMSTPVRTVDEATSLEEALAAMEGAGVRRMVVTGEEGALAGIFSLDDALELIAEEVARVGRILARQGRGVMPR